MENNDKLSQIFDFVFSRHQSKNLYGKQKVDMEKEKIGLKKRHNYSSQQTFKLFFKSMDAAINNKIEKVQNPIFIYKPIIIVDEKSDFLLPSLIQYKDNQNDFKIFSFEKNR